MGYRERQVLTLIYETGPVDIMRLAHELQLRTSDAWHLMDKMEDKKLVKFDDEKRVWKPGENWIGSVIHRWHVPRDTSKPSLK